MSPQPYLSVIIPCYNELENLRRGVLDEAYSFLKTLPFKWELIISDDGSTDGGGELISSFALGKERVRVLENEHGGKPAAIFAGVKAVEGEFLLFTDMDQSTPLAELLKLFPYFGEYEVIIGSRSERKNFPLYRKIGSRVFRLIRKSILLREINDTQCGFKAMKTGLAREIFPELEYFQKNIRVTGWRVTSFDVELLHIARLRGVKIKEVLVEWEDRDSSTNKKKSYFRESREMLREVLKVKWNDLRGKYRKFSSGRAE